MADVSWTDCVVKFWLSCFFLLFVCAELFEWIARLGSVQLHGVWLILGGMCLAVASNASHLPRLSGSPDAEASEETTIGGTTAQKSAQRERIT